ncbi:hypothetical protein CONPUDRAFT_77285 [Coniophora puteana RWD-64-598 SS2]|uniref:Uncharacterized protein n=1 Tax=Coniophora puteana (strain RWD-64-598) TaxID=741705 RepID=A0A5M3M9M8_CONPW|nr:uncharacterized protein CONPUDRAFT_77285 [Coniophora puteana RWD-64-598 SS2]EIW75646.1 hypothetical protein CONPUDRAFT_77285 [Coniophora puteana RWD-64-598 SS2]
MTSLEQHTEYDPHWTVIGGVKTTRVPLYKQCPSMKIGRDKPPIPIAIQCSSIAEANSVYMSLSAVIDPLRRTPSSQNLIAAVYQAQSVLILLGNRVRFYPVVVGSRVGIFISESDAVHSMRGMKYPIGASTCTLRQALAYMFAKGIEAFIPSDENILGNIIPLDIGDTAQQLNALSIGSGPPSRSDVENSQDGASSSVEHPMSQPSSTQSYGSSDGGDLDVERFSPSPRESLELPDDDTTPLVYTHIRNLRGITGTANQPLPDSRVARELRSSLGKYANYFLHSQGFELRAIKIICREFREMVEASAASDARTRAHVPGEASGRNNVDKANVFSMRMARYGMPIAEGRFLHYMISLGVPAAN